MVYVILHMECSLQQFCDIFAQNYLLFAAGPSFFIIMNGSPTFIKNTRFLASKLVCTRCSSCQLALWFSTDLLLLWTALWTLGKRFIRKIWIFFHTVSFCLFIIWLVLVTLLFILSTEGTTSFVQVLKGHWTQMHCCVFQRYRGSNTSCSAL